MYPRVIFLVGGSIVEIKKKTTILVLFFAFFVFFVFFVPNTEFIDTSQPHMPYIFGMLRTCTL
jgi:hypothetical protein